MYIKYQNEIDRVNELFADDQALEKDFLIDFLNRHYETYNELNTFRNTLTGDDLYWWDSMPHRISVSDIYVDQHTIIRHINAGEKLKFMKKAFPGDVALQNILKREAIINNILLSL